MSNSRALSRLLWKDAWVLWPLALALCLISAILYALTPLFFEGRSFIYSTWLLLFPNLFALGAPALQVGHEEESRTFQWTRTLPISWRTAFTSNLLSACVGLAAVWTVCGLLTYIAYISGDFIPSRSSFVTETWAAELYRVVTFSWMLLSLGYLCAWCLRSPVAALVAIVPLAFLSVGLTNIASASMEELLHREQTLNRTDPVFVGHANLVLMVLYGVVAAGLAYRRWMKPETEHMLPRRPAPSSAYRPAPQLPTSKPAPALALLWQATRQSSSTILAACAAVLFSLAAAALWLWLWSVDDAFALATPVLLVSLVVLGSAVFGGDQVRSQQRFLAERGLGSWLVWWTRVLPPLLGTFAVLLAVGLFSSWPGREALQVMAIIGFAAFVFGQLGGMWVRRTAVSIGVGAVLFAVAATLSGIAVYQFYPQYVWTAWLGLLVVLLATLRMCRRWMEDDRGRGYHARIVGWLGIAALAAVLPIAAIRWWTTPPAMPEWREQVLVAAYVPVATSLETEGRTREIRFVGAQVDAWSQHRDLERLREMIHASADPEKPFPVGHDLPMVVEHQLRSARSPDAYGSFGSAANRGSHFERLGGRDEWYDTLLSFAVRAANHLPRQRFTLWDADQADWYEEVAIEELERPESLELLGADRWRELISQLRTADEREEDRRRTMLVSYREYVQTLRAMPQHVAIGWYSASTRLEGLPWERARARRWVDTATRISLEQLAQGLPEPNHPANRERIKAWREALGYRQHQHPQYPPTLRWTKELDRRAAALRQRAAEGADAPRSP